jgi:hypothetical protein
VETDSGVVRGEGAEAAGRVIASLGFAVESFGHAVGSDVGDAGEQAWQMIFEGLSHMLERVEFAAASASILSAKEAPFLATIILHPEPGEV